MTTRKRSYSRRGSRHHNAKLTLDQVDEIRANPDNLTQARLAERYGVAVSTINSVLQRHTWDFDQRPQPEPTPLASVQSLYDAASEYLELDRGDDAARAEFLARYTPRFTIGEIAKAAASLCRLEAQPA